MNLVCIPFKYSLCSFFIMSFVVMIGSISVTLTFVNSSFFQNLRTTFIFKFS